MKKLLTALAILLFAVPAFAAPTLIWNFEQTANIATGFTIYSQEAVSGAPVYTNDISNISARSFAIDESCYRPGANYNFWIRAYNSAGAGPESNIAVYTREAYVPPNDPPEPIYTINIPTGAPVNIIIER
jgi:hypothetical protein